MEVPWGPLAFRAIAAVLTLFIVLEFSLQSFLLPINLSQWWKVAIYNLVSRPLRNGSDADTNVTFDHLEVEAESNGHRVILFWTQYYSEDFLPGLTLYQEAERDLLDCPVRNCQLTNNRSAIRESAAVLFHIRDLKADPTPPVIRLPHQYYVFYLLESPHHTDYDLNSLEGFFNLTFTYRLDSDVVVDSYFQHFHPQRWTKKSHFARAWEKKDKFAVIFLSNCGAPSLRDVYLEELSLYVPIDTYGNCGTLECSTKTQKQCDERVASYKFYLAFENSICKDYVTEKIYRAFNHDTIPVVYGGANYTGLFPRNSFINAFDFKSPKTLAEYLLLVGSNKGVYERYFQWRYDSVSLPPALHRHNLSWCTLCKILNAKPKLQQTYSRLNEWWNGKEQMCSVPDVKTVDGNQHWVKNPLLHFGK